MKRYSNEIIEDVKFLRKLGKTYAEIRVILKINIPKETLATWCSGIPMNERYRSKVHKLNCDRLDQVRVKSIETNKQKRIAYLNRIKDNYTPIAKHIHNKETGLIALSMLCLGEASKYGHGAAFSLGNTNPKVILLFLKLLQLFPDYDKNKIRCRVQCRADQSIAELEEYWQKVTNIPKEQFHKGWFDKRTIGKPTMRPDYKGVFRVYYLSTNTQLELETLADLVYNEVVNQGPLAYR